MKKKIVVVSLVMSMLFMGVVSAASQWGTYKGKDIIRLTVDGIPVNVSDAPAVAMDGRTMIPIYLLQQAGIKYTWDQKNKTVNISSSTNSINPINDSEELSSFINDVQSYRLFVKLMDHVELLGNCIELVRLQPTNYDDQKRVIDQINRINPEMFELFLNDSYSENNQYKTVIDALYKGKDYLLEWNDSSASSMYVVARSTLNSVFSSLDTKIGWGIVEINS